MPWLDSHDLTAASKEPPDVLEAAENFRRMVARHFPKSRPDLEAGAQLELLARGKRIRIYLGATKYGASV